MANRSTRDRSARQRAAVAARRANAHRGEPPPEEPRRGRGWVVGVVVCSLVLVAIVVVALSNSKDSPSTAAPSSVMTATLVEGADGALPLSATPVAYAVTYELQSSDDVSTSDTVDPAGTADPAGPADPAGTTSPAATGSAAAAAASDRTYTTSTESFRVQRPFRTHIDSTTGAPPGGDVQWSIVSDLGRSSSTTTGDDQPSVDTISPSAGIGDWRLDAVLPDLVADKTFVLRERRSLLGRDCQVYRTGSPLENYQITAPTDTTYADVCIDASGLVLEQVAVSGGGVLEHLTATAVDTAPTLTDDDFAITGEPASVADGGTSLSPIGGPPADDSYWGFATVPPGYQLLGRYTLTQNATDQSAVTPAGTGGTSAGTGGAADPTGAEGTVPSTDFGPTTVVTSYVDVYTNGPDTIVVMQGPTSVEPSDDNPGSDATSSGLGAVTVESKLTGTQIMAHPSATPDWFVEVSGTVGRSALLAATGGLQHAPAPS